jgi:hypothetical protein
MERFFPHHLMTCQARAGTQEVYIILIPLMEEKFLSILIETGKAFPEK